MARTYLGYTQTAANADLDALAAGTVAGFQQPGTGTVERSVAGKLGERASFFDFVPVAQQAAITAGTSSYDCSAAMTAALSSIGAFGILEVPKGIYHANNATGSLNGQKIVGVGGYPIFIKNANGPILTHSGDDLTLENIQFRGEGAAPAFTGDNLVLSGDNAKLLWCGSRYAYGRAVLATGSHVQIFGTCDIYQTATGSGYDIEIGVSGTATLYHQLVGIYTSQASGGIKLIDTGSAMILGGQFGKLWIAAGTSPSGVNGGTVTGARILGVVAIDVSTALFTANQFGSSANITIGAGTSGTSIDASNSFSGGTLTNNGNDSAFLMRQTGNDGDMHLLFGDDGSAAIMRVEPDGAGTFNFPSVRVPNNKSYYLRNAADDADGGRLGITTGNNLQLVALTSGAAIQILATLGKVQFGTVAAGVRSAVSINGLELLSLTAAQRDALTGVEEGTLIFNDDTNKLNFYTGSGWEAVTSA